MRKPFILLVLVSISVSIWISNFYYPHLYLEKGFYTLLALSIIYFVFKVVLQGRILKTIKEQKTKYSFSKIISVLFSSVFLVVLINIWVENPGQFVVASGLLGAGIAIALQDLFKNLAGGALIFLNKLYRVGDRIEIQSKTGDVMDIGILYTTLLETREWVSGDQATGRITQIPNGYVLANSVTNYTKDHGFIWDEMLIPISYDSDWKEAKDKILDIVTKETQQIVVRAEQEISKLTEKYFLDKRTVEPDVYMKLTDNWVSFGVRYPVEVRKRRMVSSRISQLILEEIEKSSNIKLASTTIDIVGFPDLNSKKSEK